MPGKSRHGKGKNPHHSKKSKAMMRQASTPLQQQAAAVAPKPVESVEAQTAPKADTTPKSVTTPEAVATPRYPYVTGELKRIGILAGIIIVVLIVLSIVL